MGFTTYFSTLLALRDRPVVRLLG